MGQRKRRDTRRGYSSREGGTQGPYPVRLPWGPGHTGHETCSAAFDANTSRVPCQYSGPPVAVGHWRNALVFPKCAMGRDYLQ